jgi:transcription termination/antitermination protein NusA
MNGPELLRIVDTMHREKSIPKEVIFNGIESALQLAAQRSAGEEEDVLVHIDRTTGQIIAQKGDQLIDPELLGRISAQSAKQVMIQKIREAESEGVYSEFQARKGEMVTGTVQRVDAGTAIVSLSKDGKNTGGSIEALLPRSEQIPGETPHVNDRVKAVVMDVRRNGHRVKIVLSRCHPDFVRALFEQEIPEIADRTIEIKAVAREAGYRSKVAVSSIDLKVDCVGACVGVRGSRIKNVIDELNGERIDIVRWNDSMQVMIPNALQPAEISEVMLYSTLGRAVVLVAEDQLSLAIGRRGQNVRLASKLVGWDIEIMTHEELGESVEKAERWFSAMPFSSPELAELLITEGFLSFTDITFLEPAQLAEMAGCSEEEADEMILHAEEMAEKIEREGEPEFERPAVVEEASVNGEVPALEGGEEGAVAEPYVVEGAPDASEEAPAGGFNSLFSPDEAAAAEHSAEIVEAPELGEAPSADQPEETVEPLASDDAHSDVQPEAAERPHS